jgi:hypothetical protein
LTIFFLDLRGQWSFPAHQSCQYVNCGLQGPNAPMASLARGEKMPGDCWVDFVALACSVAGAVDIAVGVAHIAVIALAVVAVVAVVGAVAVAAAAAAAAAVAYTAAISSIDWGAVASTVILVTALALARVAWWAVAEAICSTE